MAAVAAVVLLFVTSLLKPLFVWDRLRELRRTPDGASAAMAVSAVAAELI
jgi:hypothetical protein